MICAYIRVSTKKQLDGVSLETQKREIENYALRHNLVQDCKEIIFYIDKGKTASNTNRASLQNLLDDVRKGIVEILFLFDVSRLSRKVVDVNILLDEIEKFHVKVYYVSDRIDRSNASTTFQSNIEFSHNQFESDRAKEKTNKGLIYIVEELHRCPLGGKMPIGWEKDQDKNWIVYEKEAKYIRKAINMLAEGKRVEKVIQYLKKYFPQKKWNYPNLERFIKDRKLRGELFYKNKLYYDVIPAIVTKEEQLKAISMFKLNKIKKGRYIFDDVMYCHICGEKMSMTSGHNRTGDRYNYYFCKNHKKYISEKNIIKNINIEERDKLIKRRDNQFYNKELVKLNNRVTRIKEDYINEYYTEREYLTLITPLEEMIERYTMLKAGNKLIVNESIPFNLMSSADQKKFIISNVAKIVIEPYTQEVTKIVYKI